MRNKKLAIATAVVLVTLPLASGALAGGLNFVDWSDGRTLTQSEWAQMSQTSGASQAASSACSQGFITWSACPTNTQYTTSYGSNSATSNCSPSNSTNCAAANYTTGICPTNSSATSYGTNATTSNGSTCATSNCSPSNCTTTSCATANCTTGNCPTGNCPTTSCATSSCPTTSNVITSTPQVTVKELPSRYYYEYINAWRPGTYSPSQMPAAVPCSVKTPSNPSTPSTPATDDHYTMDALTKQEQEAANYVNEDRAKNGKSTLPVDAELSELARMKSEDMANNNYFAHTSPTLGSASDMLQDAGYSFTSVGENIAHHSTVEKAQAAFMSSTGHRQNILGSQWTRFGVGIAHDKNGYVYETQLFAR